MKWEDALEALEDIILEHNQEEKSSDKIAAIKLYAQINGKLKSEHVKLEEEVTKWLERHSD